MPPESFCVFILSHGRPDRVVTLDTLRASGYTGDWRIVIDNEDETRDEYTRRYGDNRVTVFDKAAIAQTFDTADLATDRRTVVFARNACFDIARAIGVRYFLELDDDYNEIRHRYEDGDQLRRINATDLDRLFCAMVEFLEGSGAASVAFGQSGDLVGGLSRSSYWHRKLLRKAMNSFFCRADDEWRFIGRVNEDVNTYTTLAHRGLLFFTTLYTTVNQETTQQNAGGMTDVYLNSGTYAKSFYPVMMCPSAVRVATLRTQNARIHHQIDWNACAPKILSERYRRVHAMAAD